MSEEYPSQLCLEVARIIYGMDQDSVETPFGNLTCGPLLNDLCDTADQILNVPRIAKALRLQGMLDDINNVGGQISVAFQTGGTPQ